MEKRTLSDLILVTTKSSDKATIFKASISIDRHPCIIHSTVVVSVLN